MRAPNDFDGITCDGQILTGGFLQVPLKILLNPRLSPGAKLAYQILLYYNWKHRPYPGHAGVADAFNLPERSLKRYLAELISDCQVEVLRHGRGQPNSYHLPAPKLDLVDWEPAPALARETLVRQP